jgi:hypothetical protein
VETVVYPRPLGAELCCRLQVSCFQRNLLFTRARCCRCHVTGPLAIAIGGQDRLFPTACYFDDNPACSFFYDVHHGTVNTMCEGNTIDGPYVRSHLSAGPFVLGSSVFMCVA